MHRSAAMKEWQFRIQTTILASFVSARTGPPLTDILPMGGPVWIDRVFYLPRRKCDYNSDGTLQDKAPVHHITSRGMHAADVDNLDKALLDVLTNVRLWIDDSLVVDGRLAKRYADNDNPPGVIVKVWRWPWAGNE